MATRLKHARRPHRPLGIGKEKGSASNNHVVTCRAWGFGLASWVYSYTIPRLCPGSLGQGLGFRL